MVTLGRPVPCTVDLSHVTYKLSHHHHFTDKENQTSSKATQQRSRGRQIETMESEI